MTSWLITEFSKLKDVVVRNFGTGVYTVSFLAIILSSSEELHTLRVAYLLSILKCFVAPIHLGGSFPKVAGQCVAGSLGAALGGGPVLLVASIFPGDPVLVAGVALALLCVPPQFSAHPHRLVRTVASALCSGCTLRAALWCQSGAFAEQEGTL